MATRKKDTNLHPATFSEPPTFPTISKPFIVGHFSVNEQRQYIADASNCKYVTRFDPNQRISFDLNHGFDRVVHKIDEAADEKLNHLLMFISQNIPKLLDRTETKRMTKPFATDVVCFRGLLRLLMCTPYENRDRWIILATKYRGTIYLCAQETEEHRRDRQNESHETKRILSYGFKFEQYIMTGEDNTL